MQFDLSLAQVFSLQSFAMHHHKYFIMAGGFKERCVCECVYMYVSVSVSVCACACSQHVTPLRKQNL